MYLRVLCKVFAGKKTTHNTLFEKLFQMRKAEILAEMRKETYEYEETELLSVDRHQIDMFNL